MRAYVYNISKTVRFFLNDMNQVRKFYFKPLELTRERFNRIILKGISWASEMENE